MNSPERTIIISPELPPSLGGISDYTANVVAHWPRVEQLSFIVLERAGVNIMPLRGYPVTVITRQRAALLNELPKDGGKVLLQYSAYGFDRFGYPRWLIQALIDWKRKSRGWLCLMFHEIWTFWPFWNKNYILQQLHRREIRRLLDVADAIFTSTESQAEHLASLAPSAAIRVLPVGSNISRVHREGLTRTPGSAVIFGLQESRLRALRKMQMQLKALCAAGKILRIISVGPTVSNEERGMLEELGLREGFEQRGRVAETEISELLLQSEFAISAQDELSISKSGTFMALAAHGVNIISPHAEAAKPEPLSFLTAPQELLNGIEKEVLERRAGKLQQWQERTSSWPHIAEAFAQAMRINRGGNFASRI